MGWGRRSDVFIAVALSAMRMTDPQPGVPDEILPDEFENPYYVAKMAQNRDDQLAALTQFSYEEIEDAFEELAALQGDDGRVADDDREQWQYEKGRLDMARTFHMLHHGAYMTYVSMTDATEPDRPDVGDLNQEEIDRLSVFLEENLADADRGDRAVLVNVLGRLPDSEYGRGELPDDISPTDDD